MVRVDLSGYKSMTNREIKQALTSSDFAGLEYRVCIQMPKYSIVAEKSQPHIPLRFEYLKNYFQYLKKLKFGDREQIRNFRMFEFLCLQMRRNGLSLD
jgi:hypothetical protein